MTEVYEKEEPREGLTRQAKLSRSAATIQKPVRNTGADLVKKVNSYLNNHYKEHVTLHMIAGNLLLNDSYVSRAYKNASGMTITDYLTNLRIDKAKKLIRKNEKKLYEIADEVGFSDAAYFTNVFVKTVGVNPSEYKKLQLL